MTYQQCLECLGKKSGIAFRMKGRKEIPQELFEMGFIEHTTSVIFSHTESRDIKQYTTVVFDKGELKDKSFEFSN